MSVVPNAGKVVVAAGLMILSGAITTAAYAATVWGVQTDIGVINGRNYNMQTEAVSFSGTYVFGSAHIRNSGGGNVPVNHIGAQASIWKDASTPYACRSSAWSYNTWESATWSRDTSGETQPCGAGYYWGDGQVRVWKPAAGNYSTHYPVRTPNIYN